jgi:ribose transport system substrate-binding protein
MKKKTWTAALCLLLGAVMLVSCTTQSPTVGTTETAQATETTAESSDSGTTENDTAAGTDSGAAVEPLDTDDYLISADAEKTESQKEFEQIDIMNGHDASAFVKEAPYTIGVSFQDLTNPVWASIAEYLQIYGEELDMEFTIVDCGGDASKQVSQIENYIQSGVDGVFIGGVDGAALEDVSNQCLDAGIPLVGIALTFAYGNSVLVPPDKQAGEAAAIKAAEWIDEHFDGKTQIAILNYPQEVALLDRGNAIKEKLEELVPDSEIVAIESAINVSEGYDATEAILQAYPDVKVICTIGDGGALGASEAVIAAGKNTDDFAIFGIDGTDEAIVAINDPDNPYRASISFGGGKGWAKYAVDTFEKIFSGEEVSQTQYMPVIPVDESTMAAYQAYAEQ